LWKNSGRSSFHWEGFSSRKKGDRGEHIEDEKYAEKERAKGGDGMSEFGARCELKSSGCRAFLNARGGDIKSPRKGKDIDQKKKKNMFLVNSSRQHGSKGKEES